MEPGLHDRYLAQRALRHTPPTFLHEYSPRRIRKAWRRSKAVLLIFAFQSPTPPKHQVLGKAGSITCQHHSHTHDTNKNKNLEAKTPGIHGICRLISQAVP